MGAPAARSQATADSPRSRPSPDAAVASAWVMCYFYNTSAKGITDGIGAPHRAHPTRAADHGHPLPARTRDRRRGHGRPPRRAQLLHRAHAAAGPRRERACPSRRGRAALHLLGRRPSPCRAQVGAQASGRHLLRRIGGEGRGSAPRRRSREGLERGARSHRRSDREGEKRRRAMSLSLEVAFKTTVLFLLVLGALPLLRWQSAALRHYVLASAFACAVAIPALTLIAPAWRMPVSAAWLGLESPSTMTFVSSPQATPSASAQSSNVPAPPPTARVSTVQILAGIWGLGALVGVGIVMAGMWRVRRLSLHGRELVDGPWRGQADEIAREFGIERPVRLVHSPHPTLLVTWGSMQPWILLPASALGWSDDRVRVVLCHELAHVTRHDWMILIAANLLRSVYWFNPLVWIAYRRLRHESEQACDDLVLARGVAPADYAAQLLAVARETVLRRHAWSPATAIAHPSTLEGRVRAMLNQSLNRTPLTLAGRLTAMMLAIGSTIVIAGVGVSVLAAPPQVSPAPVQPPQSTVPSSTGTSTIDLPNATIEASGSRVTADRIVIVHENAQLPAASGPGRITGVLYDQTGGLLPGVNVSLVQRPDGAGYSTVTDRNGAFAFELLPSGDYELASSLPGFSTVTTLVKVNAGAVAQRSITMPIGSLQETVTVTGGDGIGKSATAGVRRGQPRPAPESRTFFSGGIGGQIKQPTKIVHVSPIFPPEAGRASDVVALSARIGIDGFLSDIREVNDRTSTTAPAAHAAFLASALDAVRQWEFTPTLLNSVPVDVNMKINVSYNGR